MNYRNTKIIERFLEAFPVSLGVSCAGSVYCFDTADIHHPGCEVIKSDSRKWDGDENHDQVQKPLGPEAWEIPVHLPTFEKRNSTF